jgi:hypothetical protein
VLATAGSVGGRENGMQACPSLGTATARCLEGRAVLLSGSRATAPLQCMLQPQRMVRLHLLSCLHSPAQPLHTPCSMLWALGVYMNECVQLHGVQAIEDMCRICEQQSTTRTYN